ncbi:MAG TPA: hypothetical protein DIW30_07485 [Bacteroidales bacterium]|nr:hypothetical protein [Bacteroidales bacterium]
MNYPVKYSPYQVSEAISRLQDELKPLLLENTVIVVVMNGGVFLSSRLLFDLSVPVDLRYVKVTSYSGKQQGAVSVADDSLGDVSGRPVIVMDDICDSGTTVNAMHRLLLGRGATSVEYFTLLKRSQAQTDRGVSLHYGIYDDSSYFFVGCGLDDNGVGRNMLFIGVL